MKFKQAAYVFLISAALLTGISVKAQEHTPASVQKVQDMQYLRYSYPEKAVFPFTQYKVISQYGFSDNGFQSYTVFDVHGYVYAPFDGTLNSDEHSVTLKTGLISLVFENAKPMLNDGPVQAGEKIACADGAIKLHMFYRNMPMDFLYSFFPDKSELELKKQTEEKARSELQAQQPGNTQKTGTQGNNTVTEPQKTLPKTEYDSIFDEAGKETNIDPLFLKTIAYIESGFNPKAVSPKGATGIMQLMPGTAQMLGVKDIYNPEENIKAGAKYLRMMADTFNNNMDLTLAAYNAGPQPVKQYNGIPPYKETQNFVKAVENLYASLKGK